MKKDNLKKMAILGITSGLIVSGQASDLCSSETDSFLLAKAATSNGCQEHGCPASKPTKTAMRDPHKNPYRNPIAVADAPEKKLDNKKEKGKGGEYDPNDENIGYHLMTDDEIRIELNEEGLRMYNQLDEAGKELARKVASVRCQATNECKGLNACKTDKNECAGKGSCKHTGKCAISDKNLAVKLVYDKLNKKRTDALKK